jgi:type I restriction enzyme R subunit
LSGVQTQAEKYSSGLPDELSPPIRPLPFLYSSTGTETLFRNDLDPDPRSRRVFSFHRPATLAEWLQQKPLSQWVEGWRSRGELEQRKLDLGRPSTLRSRLRCMPDVVIPGLWRNKVEGITRLENSLYDNRPRALIQMATGSGKTKLAITATYRLIKYAGARRVLFLVDRSNLAEQAEKEFQSYVAPDVNRKFTELYNVQRLTSNKIGESAKVVITTIQRLYSMLSGEAELDPELEEHSGYDADAALPAEPVHLAYDPAIPIEFFDVIWIDECHRSIYSLWREVLEYFDAFLLGLTATPAKHTFGFFNKNLVMEYGFEQAVADGVNVDFDVYDIRTQITQSGATVVAGPDVVLGHRDKATRQLRWEQPDENLTYTAADLDRNVVSKDQIRTIVRTFKEKLPTDIFPGRREVPKTLIFAKDDSHAEDIVEILRDEFGRGDQFAQKITYKTTGDNPKQLIQDFRTDYWPRVAVTVDMIATGTDIKPIEIVMFMRTVKSRVLFDQMKGRGVRIIDKDELKAVTPDALSKDRFVIVDCVGVCDQEKTETRPLDRKKSTSFKELLEHVASGGTNEDYVSSLASRLARLDQQCGVEEHTHISTLTGGKPLVEITQAIFKALAPEKQEEAARTEFSIPEDVDPTPEQIKHVASRLCKEAVRPLATNPKLRKALIEFKTKFEQIIDEVTEDKLLTAGISTDAREKARTLVQSFEQFIAENRDEIDALQFLYNQPARQRLHYKDIKELAAAISAPPRQWTPEKLWRAYGTVEKDRVRNVSGQRTLTDIVSLVRFALHRDGELKPFGDQVRERFQNWMAQQETQQRKFTDEQRRWLEMMRDHVATSLEIGLDDLDDVPFNQQGGLGRAQQVFAGELGKVLRELNEALAA